MGEAVIIDGVLSHELRRGVFCIHRESICTSSTAFWGSADLITEQYPLVADEVIESLRRVDLFRGLPDDELRALVEVIKGVKAGEGDHLFDEGDEDDRFFLVIEGAVEIVKAVPGGGEEKLAVRRAGDVFGEMALLNDAPRSATARAAGECECLTLSRGDFERLMGGDSLALRLLKILSQALRALGIRFVNIERGGRRPPTTLHEKGQVPVERSPPRVDGFDIGVSASPSASGVDLSTWEALRFSDGRIALVALAVQGDRVPPLHSLAVARALFTEFSLAGEQPETLLAHVNDSLYRNQLYAGDQFVATGMLLLQGDDVFWSNAGGIHGAIRREDGTVNEFPDHGPPLGMMTGFRHEMVEIPISSGDMILVQSGGSRGLFRGAVHSLTDLRGAEAGKVVERVHEAIRATQESDPDEPTVIFLRRD